MGIGDGTRLMQDAKGNSRMISATRWQELCDTLNAVADVSTALGARTDFHLLNASPDGQFLTLGDAAGSQDTQVPRAGPLGDHAGLQRLLSTGPQGSTPLTEAVVNIISVLTPAADQMRAQGQQAVVVLATDGMPNDKSSFVQAVRQLQTLPTWVVVRLCTSEDSVVDYWSDLDKHLEAPLEVLDDQAGEAAEIRAHNGWLAYGPPLHLAREFGLREKMFDLLDESPLMPSQIKQFCEILLGCDTLPEPELDPAAFAKHLKAQVDAVPKVYDPVKKSAVPWIDVGALSKHLKGKDGCTIS